MKKMYLAVLGLLLFVPFTSEAFSGPGCGGECKDCHKLEKVEAEEIVKKVISTGTVLDIKTAPVKSLWQIDVQVGDKRGSIYVDFTKKYILDIRQIALIETIGKPRIIDFSKLPLKEAIILGPKKAEKKVAVFTDPDCPYCRKLHDEMKQLLSKRKDVAFYIFLRPLPMHKEAYKKSQAVLCEKSLTLLDDAFAGKPLPEPKCSGAQVDKNNALADSLEFGGTPTMVRDDGTVSPGYLPADQLSVWIDNKKEAPAKNAPRENAPKE